ncbi:hypothetical protein JCM8202_004619 [Rhodotorula sphaerocarpa]
MSTQAPPEAGPSTSSSAAPIKRQSPWDPYAALPPSARRRIDPEDNVKPKSYAQELAVPAEVAEERVVGKLLQLDPPEGKVSDRRKAELAVQEAEKEKKKKSKKNKAKTPAQLERRERKAFLTSIPRSLPYAAAVPLHELWLGYIAELLDLPIRTAATASMADRTSVEAEGGALESAISSLLSSYTPRPEPGTPRPAPDEQFNVPVMQAKLVKAEFVGCSLKITRSRAPECVNRDGIVIQETHCTFIIVTPNSRTYRLPKQGTVFTIDLPLEPVQGSTEPRKLSFDLYGDAFNYRPADRIAKKWKAGTGAGGVDLQ